MSDGHGVARQHLVVADAPQPLVLEKHKHVGTGNLNQDGSLVVLLLLLLLLLSVVSVIFGSLGFQVFADAL